VNEQLIGKFDELRTSLLFIQMYLGSIAVLLSWILAKLWSVDSSD